MERNIRVKNILEDKYYELFARSHGIKKKASVIGLSNLKQEIIQSGIPLQQSEGKYAPHSIERQLRVIYVGKLIQLKHVDKIIEAMGILNNQKIYLEIVGEGPEEEKLKNLVNEKKLYEQVEFVDKLPREEVFSHMANANLFCMPSYPETLGLTYLEAMSVGCVPIGTMGEGIDGIIIDGQNGYLVDPNDLVDDLVNKINTYYSLTDLDRKQMSINAKESVRQLDEPRCARYYLELIKRSVVNAGKE